MLNFLLVRKATAFEFRNKELILLLSNGGITKEFVKEEKKSRIINKFMKIITSFKFCELNLVFFNFFKERRFAKIKYILCLVFVSKILYF